MLDLLIGGIAAWFVGDTLSNLAGHAASLVSAKAAADQQRAMARQRELRKGE